MRWGRLRVVALAAVLLGPPAAAGWWSRSYEFRADVPLEISERTDNGVRVDQLRFHLPATSGDVRAELRLSNTAEESRFVGVAMALFDAEGRLVGVASAGTDLLPMRAGRQKRFDLVFDHVSDSAPTARTFHLTVEAR